MTIGSFLTWLVTVAGTAFASCLMCDAVTPLMLTIAGVLCGMFFAPFAFTPARTGDAGQRCNAAPFNGGDWS